jgi:hypothetical protein
MVVAPPLATLSREPFSDADWLFERKLDGGRAASAISTLADPAVDQQLSITIIAVAARPWPS